MQINRLGPLMQMRAIGGSQNCATASGQHASAVLRELLNHLFLKVTKGLLTLAREKFTNRASNSLLNDLVRVNEFDIKPSGKLPANRGLTRTR
jgi:hypothetical protein